MATKERSPTLTEAHIRKLASAQSFARGNSYFHQGTILEPTRQGNVLRAWCEGSAYEPYQLSVTLTTKGIGKTSCTCPYDWGGLCKHVVALLLTYVHTPEVFRVIPPLDALLAQRSKADLIALIGTLLEREPSLLAILPHTSVEPVNIPQQPRRQSGTQDPAHADVLQAVAQEQHDDDQRLDVTQHASAGIEAQTAPQEAIARYKELVERAINGRQRRTYQQAVQHLRHMQALYTRLKRPSDWQTYVQTLRRHYAHLPALQDELHQARF
jgi:uncharacterized Zn finger protein